MWMVITLAVLTDFQPEFAQTVLRWNIARLKLQNDFIFLFFAAS